MKKAFIAILTITLSACGDNGEIVKEIQSKLIDPDSAKFGDITIINNYACATVNAKNKMGGYSGNQQAFMKRIDGSWKTIRINEQSHKTCIEYANEEIEADKKRYAEKVAFEKLSPADKETKLLTLVLDPITVNLTPDADGKSDNYLKIIVRAKFRKESLVAEARGKEKNIRNYIVLMLAGKKASQISSDDNNVELLKDIKSVLLRAITLSGNNDHLLDEVIVTFDKLELI